MNSMSSLRRQVLNNKFGLPLIPSGGNPARSPVKRKLYTPLSWKEYFTTFEDVAVDSSSFRVYRRGDEGPLLILLHGGGYCGLTWSAFSERVTSYAHCQVAAIDLRGHGDTHTDNEEDLSADRLSNDVANVIKAMFPVDPPVIVLVGHSMGGAVAVHTAHRELLPTLAGLVVIDVVEGTAMDALQSMQSFLRGRPSTFNTIENAIEWCVRSGQVRNTESARVSMPGQIKNSVTNKTSTCEVDNLIDKKSSSHEGNGTAGETDESAARASYHRADVICEADEEEDDAAAEHSQKKSKTDADSSGSRDSGFTAPRPVAQYTWRIDLSKSEKFWSGWFTGLSNMFLSCNVPKMLLLAGVDRLDKELTVGQMQGKFQMQVLPQCGHAVHEDVPDRVAEVLATFLVRQKLAEMGDDFQMSFPAC